MTDQEREQIRKAARQAVEASCRAQGLPVQVTDPAVIAKVAAIVRGSDQEAA